MVPGGFGASFFRTNPPLEYAPAHCLRLPPFPTPVCGDLVPYLQDHLSLRLETTLVQVCRLFPCRRRALLRAKHPAQPLWELQGLYHFPCRKNRTANFGDAHLQSRPPVPFLSMGVAFFTTCFAATFFLAVVFTAAFFPILFAAFLGVAAFFLADTTFVVSRGPAMHNSECNLSRIL